MAVLVDYRGKPQYDIYVKGSPEVPELGDCKRRSPSLQTLVSVCHTIAARASRAAMMPQWLQGIHLLYWSSWSAID